MSVPLDDAIAELQQAAERLRAGGLDGDEAAALVERCADLAGDIGQALEREAREARAEPLPGQEKLLP